MRLFSCLQDLSLLNKLRFYSVLGAESNKELDYFLHLLEQNIVFHFVLNVCV